MSTSDQLVSPKQVARGLGVSESSLKRWCDQGRIETVRTAGGHRKIAIAEALRYAREQNMELASPDLLSLPVSHGLAAASLDDAALQMVAALLKGDEIVTRQIVFDLYAKNYASAVICDDVVATAFHKIGELWACNSADVYQERRACEIIHRVLFEVRRLQAPKKRPGTAAGGTAEGDHYSLSTAMAELVLREAGFTATSIGTSIPWPSLVHAVEQMKVDLFWLSVSYISDGCDFVSAFTALSKACVKSGTALVVGGRGLSEDLRRRVTYSAFCDSLQHLESFATTLRRSLKSRPLERSVTKPSIRASRK